MSSTWDGYFDKLERLDTDAQISLVMDMTKALPNNKAVMEFLLDERTVAWMEKNLKAINARARRHLYPDE